MGKKLEKGSKVKVTQQYVENVDPIWKAMEQEIVGQEGYVVSHHGVFVQVQLPEKPLDYGRDYQFWPDELELI